MLKTLVAVAAGAFIVKRAAPDAYDKAIRVAGDIIDTTSDVMTAVRGQAKAYCAEAAADATKRLQDVDPAAIEKLRAMLDGSQPSQPAQQPQRRLHRRP